MVTPPLLFRWGFFYPPSHWNKIIPVNFYQTINVAIRKVLIICLLSFCLSGLAPQNVSAAYQRIISTSPSITEILFAIGAGNRVVGVTDFCSYPERACSLPSIGGPLNPSTEAWISLKPDLIIHQTDSEIIHKNANNFGIPSLSVSVENIKSILTTTQKIADSLNIPRQGQQLVQKLKTGIKHYQTQLNSQVPKQVLLLLGDTNDPARDLYAVGKGTFLDELLSIAGGENVLPNTMAKYPKLSKEFIISKSPEVIIEVGPMSNLTKIEIKKRKQDWSKFSTIRAIQTDNIHFIGADYILIPGPRLLNIIGKFSHTIHPSLFPDRYQSRQEKVSQ